MKLANPLPAFCRAMTVVFTVCLLGLPAISHAADATTETGVRLLEAELVPTKVTLLTVKCDQLVIAVSKTTLAHPGDAVSILHAALTRGVKKLRHEEVATLSCTCARRIFLASVAAAPKRSSEFLDLATELYPDCTPEFADALRDFGAETAFGEPYGLSEGGFGVGFGPGFPGSPGFTGSAPSGATALPPTAVTIVVNG